MIIRRLCPAILLAFAVMTPAAWADMPTNSAADYREVRDLIRAHLSGVTDADLDQAALNGLLNGFDGRVTLEGNPEAMTTNGPLTSRVDNVDERVGYLRINRVADGLATEVSQDWQALNSTNTLLGLVIDLRFAGGTDYAAAAAAADLFVSGKRLLLDYGDMKANTTSKTNVVTVPLAVLINHETSGAAEALAAVLRQAGSAVLLGDTTAGRAMVMQNYPLQSGGYLSIAAKPVKLGDGTALSTRGVKADIQVAVTPDAEKTYFDDPYAEVVPPSLSLDVAANDENGEPIETNKVTHHPRLSEADLVREKREGISMDDDTNMLSTAPGPETPSIHDPVLARAVDLLKALAVVRDQHN